MKRVLIAAFAAAVIVGCQSGTETKAENTTTDASTSGATTTASAFTPVHDLLNEKCVKCHGATNPKEGLNLTSYEGLMKGTEDGPAVVAGKPDESLIIKAMRGQGAKKMPPMGDPVPEDKIKEVEAWIAAGAKA